MPRGVSSRATQEVSCYECTHVSTSDVMHMEHFKLQHPTLKPFKCTQNGCNKMFPSRRNLKGHMTTHETTRATFKCPQCPQEFLNECSVAAHVRDLHPIKQQMFKCSFEGCLFTTTAERYLASHEEVHSENRRTFHCDQAGCSSTFHYKLSLDLHRKNHERPRDKEFKCSGCPFQTNRLSKLNSHLNEVHNNSRPHACPREGCTETFKRPAHLREHLDRMHVDMRRLDNDDETDRYRNAFKQDHDGNLQIPRRVEHVVLTMVKQDFPQLTKQYKIDCRCIYDSGFAGSWAQVIVDGSIRLSEKKVHVLVEVDENQHKTGCHNSPLQEVRRMQDATDALREMHGEDYHVLWVRFNPTESFKTTALTSSEPPSLAQRISMLRDFLNEYEPPLYSENAQVAYFFYDSHDDENLVRVINLLNF